MTLNVRIVSTKEAKIDAVAHLMYMFVVHKYLILCLLLTQIFVLNTRN